MRVQSCEVTVERRRTPGLLFRLGIVFGWAISASACADVTRPIDPALNADWIRAAWLRTDAHFAGMGCAVAVTYPEGVRAIYLPRRAVPFALPQIDSVRRVGRAATGARVVTIEVPRVIDGSKRTVNISCLVPADFRSNNLATAAMRTIQLPAWNAIERRLVQSPIRGDLKASVFPASERLRQIVRSPASPDGSFTSHSSNLYTSSKKVFLAPSRPCFDYFDGANPFRSDDHTQSLPR